MLGTLGPGGGVGFGTPLVSTQPRPVADAGTGQTGQADLSGLPDIVVILTDDQRVETLAGMPHVQALLADQGTTFSRAMVPTSLCCPSRASMLTGSYAHDTGVWTNVRPDGGWWAFRAGGNEERTVAVALQQQGYRTALVGKYFNTFGLYAPPGYRPPGWDEFLAFTTMDRSGDYYDYTLSDGSVHGSKPRDYSTDVLAAAATDVVRTTPATQPLFLWYAPYAPHGPYRPAPRHRHAAVALQAEPGGEDVSTKPHWVQALDPPTAEKVSRAARRQQQALMAVDEAVAGLVDALADTGRLSDTLIVFASDNGLLWGEHSMLDKNVPYTPGHRGATGAPLGRARRRRAGGRPAGAEHRHHRDARGGRADRHAHRRLGPADPGPTRRVRARGCRRPTAAATAVLRLAGGRLDLRALLDRRGGALLARRRPRRGAQPRQRADGPRPAGRDAGTGPRGLHAGAAGLRLVSRQSRSDLRGHCGPSASTTDSTLPAGSVNHAISGPPPRKMPFSSVAAGVPS